MTSTPRMLASPSQPGRVERAVRAGWGAPGPVLRAAASLYGLAGDVRGALWETGILRSRVLPVPVVSIGGITVGGAGKTPIAAALGRRLAEAGYSVGIVTPGERDELLLHEATNPDLVATGGRDRTLAGRDAIRRGAEIILLDSGFQHRRLHRDLDLVAIAAQRTPVRHLLPAGPYRERLSAVRRADGALLVRRGPDGGRARGLRAELHHVAPHLHIAEVNIAAAGLRAGNASAEAVETPRPSIAVAGIMWPEPFFATLRALGVDVDAANHVALRDHAPYERGFVDRLAILAGTAGIVCTRKDAVKLMEHLPAAVPLWWVEEKVVWGSGSEQLFEACRRVCGAPDRGSARRRSA